jgi:hypothetical protein
MFARRGRDRYGSALAAVVFQLLVLHSPAAAADCPSDCNADQTVTIDELVICVAITLDRAPVELCAVSDRNDDNLISIDELMLGVRSGLEGCAPEETPTATPTASGSVPVETPTPTRTGTPSEATPSPTSTPTMGSTATRTPTRTGTPTRTPTTTPTRTMTPTPSPTQGFSVISFGSLFGQPGSPTSFDVNVGADGLVTAVLDFCFPEDVFEISPDEFNPNPDCQSSVGSVAMEFCDGVTGSACDPSCSLPFGRRVRVTITGIDAPKGEELLDCGSLPIKVCADDSPNTVPCPPKSTAVCYPVGIEAKLTNAEQQMSQEAGQIVLQMFPE